MKVGDKPAPRGAAKIRTEAARASQGRSATATVNGAIATAAPVDTASILGIPEAELTPKVRAAIAALMAEVENLRRELRITQHRFEELEQDANLDPLVPVLNRRAFVREMSRLISFTGRYHMAASLIYFDLNDFKTLNDSYGHAAGDAALVHVGTLLQGNVRESDLVGRLGGDEFGLILANANEDVAHKKAEILADLLAATPFLHAGESLSLRVAYGVYAFKPGEDARAAMAHADREMFARKRSMKKKSS